MRCRLWLRGIRCGCWLWLCGIRCWILTEVIEGERDYGAHGHDGLRGNRLCDDHVRGRVRIVRRN